MATASTSHEGARAHRLEAELTRLFPTIPAVQSSEAQELACLRARYEQPPAAPPAPHEAGALFDLGRIRITPAAALEAGCACEVGRHEDWRRPYLGEALIREDLLCRHGREDFGAHGRAGPATAEDRRLESRALLEAQNRVALADGVGSIRNHDRVRRAGQTGEAGWDRFVSIVVWTELSPSYGTTTLVHAESDGVRAD